MRSERVLVPVDFSPASSVALDCAVTWARRFRASLILLHVLDPHTMNEDQAQRKLSAMVTLEDHRDLNVRTVVTQGDAQEKILSSIWTHDVDLVAMGIHGRSLLDRIFLGSVTLGVMRNIDVPVLTVSQATRPLRFERILFATDLTEGSCAQMQSVLDIAQSERSTVTLFHAVDVGLLQESALPMGAYVTPDYMEQARSGLDELVATAAQHSVATETVLVEGMPAESILSVAEEKHAGLIVLSTAHKGFLERALVGSTSERVIRGSAIPVLSLPKVAQADVRLRPAV
jgi:nucleotide-binding universal stress UspA family protein